MRPVFCVTVLVLIALAVLAPSGAATHATPRVDALHLEAAEGTRALLGEPLLLRALALDASGRPVAHAPLRLEPFGAEAASNRHGLALFRVERDVEGVVTARLHAPGATDELALVWSRAVLLSATAPSIAYTSNEVEVRVEALWSADRAPAAGLDVVLELTAETADIARTGEDGLARFRLGEQVVGPADYAVRLEDGPRTTFRVDWRPPPIMNHAPVLESVAIAAEGGIARAILGRAYDPDGDPVRLSYRWSRDGGEVPRYSAPSLAYGPGETLQLEVTPDDGRSVGAPVRSELLRIPALNRPPTAVVRLDGDAVEGRAVVLDATGSTDDDGSLVAFVWSFSHGGGTEGSRVEQRFPAGPAWAVLRVMDDARATSVARLDFEVLPAPLPPVEEPAEEPIAPPRVEPFRAVVNGAEFTLAERPASSTVARREIRVDDAPALLLVVPEGLALWTPAAGTELPVTKLTPPLGEPRHQPGALTFAARADGDAASIVLLEIPSPQPGLGAPIIRGALASWREGTSELVLTRGGSTVELAYDVPAFSVHLGAKATERLGEWQVTGEALGGAPLATLTLLRGETALATSTERSLAWTHEMSDRQEELRLVGTTVAGEVAEARLALALPEPIEPAGERVQHIPAAEAQTPAPGPLVVLATLAGLALARRRLR